MEKITWEFLQSQSDDILSDGLYLLKSNPIENFSDVVRQGFGNYLISIDKKSFYIGEAKEITKRIKQQAKVTTSTFYKNYQRETKKNQLFGLVDIDKFKVQTIATNIGRKEVEEFGIVNLPTILNSFQLGKRKKVPIAENGLWNIVQDNFLELLAEGENKIIESNFTPWLEVEIVNSAGLYLVKDKSNKLIYIGESSNVGERITTHSGRTYFSALRRHIGTDILNFKLQEINGKKRYFSDIEDEKITDFLKHCKVIIFPVAFGRYELEEYLIKKYKPLLNRKDNNNDE